MVKEAIVDYKRYKADQKINNKKCMRLNTKTNVFEVAKWKDIKVGDVIKLHNKEVNYYNTYVI
jgi:magnesium-transporting ATPase (P-type)